MLLLFQCIDLMLKQEHFVEALSLAWSFHEGTAKAMVGGSTAPAADPPLDNKRKTGVK